MTINDRNLLIDSHMGLADKLARWRKKSIWKAQYDELQAAAYTGLVQAADGYNTSLNVPFASYASPRILGAIGDYLRELRYFRRYAAERVPMAELVAPEVKDLDIDTIIKPLPERSRMVLRLYYQDDYKQEDIAKILGVTKARISQILEDGRQRLFSHMTSRRDTMLDQVV